jgi:fructose/tagatose bisphosphate aldolase
MRVTAHPELHGLYKNDKTAAKNLMMMAVNHVTQLLLLLLHGTSHSGGCCPFPDSKSIAKSKNSSRQQRTTVVDGCGSSSNIRILPQNTNVMKRESSKYRVKSDRRSSMAGQQEVQFCIQFRKISTKTRTKKKR